MLFRIFSVVVSLVIFGTPAKAQLRVVSFNTSNSSSSSAGPREGMGTILRAIGEAVSDDPTLPGDSGIVRPIDVLLLQESRAGMTAPAYAMLLNQIHNTTRYAAGTLAGATTGAGTQAIVYNAEAVTLVSSAVVGVSTTSGQPRQVLRYQLRPAGYISDEGDLFVYNAHFKAGGTSTDESRRLVEANAIRADADALPTSNVLYVGDFNIPRASVDSYQRLQSPGPAAALDPINAPGNWSGAAAFKAIHTQSPYDPAMSSGFSGSAGGVDDRFDFQLATASVITGTKGLLYATNSYMAFGNNGTHVMDAPITTGTGAPAEVLEALASTVDHLPIVADYLLRPRPGMAYPGDANLDQAITLTDFTALAASFGSSDAHWQLGDFTGDAAVNLDDFTLLAANFGTSARPAVPEPSAAIVVASFILIFRRNAS